MNKKKAFGLRVVTKVEKDQYKSNRGGLRNPPGGRPPNDGHTAMISTSIRLPSDLAQWLKDNVENRNEFIIQAIRDKINNGKNSMSTLP